MHPTFEDGRLPADRLDDSRLGSRLPTADSCGTMILVSTKAPTVCLYPEVDVRDTCL